MSVAMNKASVVRFIVEVWQAGKLAVAEPDNLVPGVGQGAVAVKQNITAFREACPDLV
jgi:hypothetical protein